MVVLFPLPSVARSWIEHRAENLSKGVRRRLFRRNLVLGMVQRAIEVLNFCSSRTLRRSARLPGTPPVRNSFPPASPAQQSVLDRLFRRCLGAGLPPRQSSQGALRELLRVQSLDDVPDATGVVPFEWEKLKLLRDTWEVVPRSVREVAPASVGDMFRRPGQFRLCEEHAAALAERDPVPPPYWDARLSSDVQLRQRFFAALRKKKLLTYRRKVHCFAGLFFVRKKGNQIRMVLDGRSTNASHKLPPHVVLGSAAAWAELDLSELAEGASLWKASGDLQDSFYQFASDELAEDFAFDFPEKARDAGVSRVWEDGRWVDVDPDDWVYNCFAAIPMGWSWAMWIVQSIVSGVLRSVMLPGEPDLVEDRRPKRRLRGDEVATGGYVDNFLVLGASRLTVQRRFLAICERFREIGIALHELREACDDAGFDYLGLEFSTDHRLRPQRPRAWRLDFAISGLLSMEKAHGQHMRCLLGHVVHFFQLAPMGLSLLAACYAFAAAHLDEFAPLWNRARNELKRIQALIFLVEVDLRAPWLPWAVCSDACEHSYAIHARPVDCELLHAVANVREKWRYAPVEKLPRVDQQTPAEASTRAPSSGLLVAGKLFAEQLSQGQARQSPPLVAGAERVTDDVPSDLVQPLPDELLDFAKWQLFLRGGWKYSATMHVKEAKASMRGLRAIAGCAERHGSQVLSLGDNLPEICACEKGRCRDPALRSVVCQALAVTMATEIRWRRRHVDSLRNPSDKDSRIRHRPGQRVPGPLYSSAVGMAPIVRRACEKGAENRRQRINRPRPSREALLSRAGRCGPRLTVDDAAEGHLCDTSPVATCQVSLRCPSLWPRSHHDESLRLLPPGLVSQRRAKDGSVRLVPKLFASTRSSNGPPGLERISRARNGLVRSLPHRGEEPSKQLYTIKSEPATGRTVCEKGVQHRNTIKC